MFKDLYLFFIQNMKRVVEYKTSFILQAITMIISNTWFFMIWYFIFKRFWSFAWFWYNDYLLLMMTLLLNFSFLHLFFWWYKAISQWAINWTLDNYMLLPGSLLAKLISSFIPSSIFWDLINWLIMPFFIPNFTVLLFFKVVYLSFVWWVVFIWFMIMVESLSFYLWSSKEISKAMFEMVLGPWNYPQNIYEWTYFKYLFMSVIPVYYIFYLPFNLSRSFNWTWFAILHLAAFISIWIWYITFKNWISRYESWNLLRSNIN